jgi:DNA-directed RNA polymerase specialized sigma subunit
MECDLSESTRLPRLPGISERDAALLAGRYFDRLTHKELAERFNLSPSYCRLLVHQLKRTLTLLRKVEADDF